MKKKMIAAGLAPGPALGRCLKQLLDIVIEDPEKNQKEILLEIARESIF